MTDERELERVAGELALIRRASIDTSSLIYLGKSLLLKPLSGALQLITVPQVVKEVGSENLPVAVFGVEGSDADDAILALAEREGVPLVSEDRKLLLRAERSQVRYYNSIVMLALLLVRGLLSEQEYHDSDLRLRRVAHYSRRVQEYGRDLAAYVLMNR